MCIIKKIFNASLGNKRILSIYLIHLPFFFSFQDDCFASLLALGVIISFEAPLSRRSCEGYVDP